MRRLLLAFAIAAAPLPAQAEECDFWNAFSDDTVTIDASETIRWEVAGGASIVCTVVDNRLARGPFPTHCDNGETQWDTTYAFFPSESGEIGALLLFDNTVWYRRCSTAS